MDLSSGQPKEDLRPEGPREMEYARAELELRPLLVIFLGMCSERSFIYVQNTVQEAWDKGYQPIVVS